MSEIRKVPLFKVYMSKGVDQRLLDILHSGYIGQGTVVDTFEAVLREWFDSPFVITTNTATSAEHLGLHMLKKPDPEREWPGIEEGDEVLATPLTCTATNWPVLANGLTLKWVDVDMNTLNIDLDDLARKVTPKTKVIMFVHWGGYPVDLDRVKEIQQQAYEIYGFKPMVIEDCAHSMGSTYKGKKLGAHGNLNTFSFQAIKHMTSVDGGVLIVPNDNLYYRGRLLRWYGIDRDNPSKKDFRCELDIEEWGYKFHMNDINAWIGMENLRAVDEVIAKHRANAAYYRQELAEVPGITLLEDASDRESAYWLFTIRVEDRDGFMQRMGEAGVMVSKVHNRNDQFTCTKDYCSILPNLEIVSEDMICIPVGWWVSKEDREYIVECIKGGW